jgi:hypothetical protein
MNADEEKRTAIAFKVFEMMQDLGLSVEDGLDVAIHLVVTFRLALDIDVHPTADEIAYMTEVSQRVAQHFKGR